MGNWVVFMKHCVLLIIGHEVPALVFLTLMMCFACFTPGEIADANLQPWHQFIRRKVRLFGIGITSTWLCSLQRLRSGRRIQVCRRVERVDVHTGHVTDLVT